MTEAKLYDHWWNMPGETEQSMEDGHQRFWQKILEAIDPPGLDQSVVMDFGCNQGGFLRFLYQHHPFKRGIGVDLARDAVRVANERKQDLPLEYHAVTDLSGFENQIDLAVSTSVLYLIQDLEGHARQIKTALKPGGVYYTSYTDYSQNPSLPTIREKINAYGALKMQEYELDDIADAFRSQGFAAGIRRLPVLDFVPIDSQDRFFSAINDRLMFEYEQAYIFCFQAPGN